MYIFAMLSRRLLCAEAIVWLLPYNRKSEKLSPEKHAIGTPVDYMSLLAAYRSLLDSWYLRHALSFDPKV